jgi:hypothetical protein
MSTSWDNAPEWANFKATDENGQEFWYEKEPLVGRREWELNSQQVIGKVAVVKTFSTVNWFDSLEKRP